MKSPSRTLSNGLAGPLLHGRGSASRCKQKSGVPARHTVRSTPANDPLKSEIDALYKDHAAGLMRYARSLVREEDLARDGVQEVFLRYCMERHVGRAILEPRAWLYQVMRNYLLERLRNAVIRPETIFDGMETLASQQADPERLAECSETARDIAASLTGRELHCLRLRTEGLSYREIAETLRIRSGTVGALLARVQGKLRRSSIPGDSTPALADALRSLVQ